MNLDNTKLTEKNTKLLCIFTLVFISFALCLSIPHNWINDFPLSDSTIFLYFGYAMKKGQVMYLDIFDHKGPLIFLINYIGYALCQQTGVWLLNVLAIFLFLFFTYKIGVYIGNKTIGMITSVFMIPMLLKHMENTGNFTEIYALPFIAFSLFVFVKFFCNEKNFIRLYEVILCGFSFGAVFLLRANMISIWMCFCSAVLIFLISKKQIQKSLIFTSFFILGFALIVTPFIIYFLIKGCLPDAVYQSLIFNFIYSVSGNSLRQIVFWAFTELETNYFFLISVVYFGIIIFKRLKNPIHLVNLVYLAVTFYFVIISRREYSHYLLTMIPCIIFPLVYVLNEAYQSYFKNKKQSLKIALTIFIFISICFLKIVSINRYINKLKEFVSYTSINMYEDAGNVIKLNSTQNDCIYTHCLNGSIYIASDRLSATRYFSLPAVNLEEFPDIFEEFFSDLYNHKPKFIVVQRTYFSNLNSITDRKLMELLNLKYYKFYENQLLYIYQIK